MNYFKKINIFGGWGVFLISAIVYTVTMEPTASLWDCSEFIATSYKLEVGHPPGAPLFMMINRLFSMFAPDTESVAAMVNFASVIASAFTIAFLFWTIAHLAVRLLKKGKDELTCNEVLLTNGAAFIGAMAYAFTDTFWFSAIEGEVYAQSSFFTAIVVWGMLRWESETDSSRSTRWIILVAYLMGLSIGVHLLNLLAIPALVLVFYYKTAKNRTKLGWWKALGISVVILAFVLFVVIPKIPAIGAWFDRIAVNSLGMPVNAGFAIFFLMLIAILSYGVYYTHIKGRVILNTAILCLTVIVLGFSSYASIVIRAVANPPMNSNAPSDPYALLSHLNREQYGSKPLLYGRHYSSPLISNYETKDVYYYDKITKKYVKQEVYDGSSAEYAPGTLSLFPRMYSSDDNHIRQYKMWANIEGKNVKVTDGSVVNVPTFAENLTYFFNYQVRYMYWRYFLWNFVGRQNDIQGDGSILNGNWLSGIKFIDEMYLGNMDNLPPDLEENKGRNRYFFLPFLLGLAGIFYQLRKDKDNFNVVMFLFLMTGLAIILYLNQTPSQPRERDYAYAGSFYAFSIWIGLGMLWVHAMLSKIKLKTSECTKTIAAFVLCMSVPVILIAQNWDDHTRSNRYIARDMGINYLSTTLPNSIIMPYGDNDTFPLWYIQEVENFRTDVKIANFSYLASDWYTDQMTERTNDAAPIDFSFPRRVYYKNNDQIHVIDLEEGYISAEEVIGFVKDDSDVKRRFLNNTFEGQVSEIIPGSKIYVPVDKEAVIRNGIVSREDEDLIVDTLFINITGNTLNRAEYMLLDMILSNDWSRPIYFTQPSIVLGKFGLNNFIQQDGVAYRFVPINSESGGRIDTEYLYDNLMNKFKYGNVSDPDVNVDEFVRHTLSASYIRSTFARLASQLALEGDKERALKVINRSLKEIPHYQLPYDQGSIRTAEALYLADDIEGGDRLLSEIIEYNNSYMDYYSSFDRSRLRELNGNIRETIIYLYNVYLVGMNSGREELVKDLEQYAEMLNQ